MSREHWKVVMVSSILPVLSILQLMFLPDVVWLMWILLAAWSVLQVMGLQLTVPVLGAIVVWPLRGLAQEATDKMISAWQFGNKEIWIFYYACVVNFFALWYIATQWSMFLAGWFIFDLLVIGLFHNLILWDKK